MTHDGSEGKNSGRETQSGDGWLKQHEGWARLVISTVVWVATVGYIAGQSSEQQKTTLETVNRASALFTITSEKLNTRLDNLSDQVTRLAVSNERLSVQLTDQVKAQDELRRRVEKVEDRR